MELYRNKILFSTYLLSLFLLVVAFSMVYVQLGEVQHLLIIHFDSYNEVPDFLESKDNIYRKDPPKGSFSLNNCCG